MKLTKSELQKVTLRKCQIFVYEEVQVTFDIRVAESVLGSYSHDKVRVVDGQNWHVGNNRSSKSDYRWNFDVRDFACGPAGNLSSHCKSDQLELLKFYSIA